MKFMIEKRDGSTVDFDSQKIQTAMEKAFVSTGTAVQY